MYSRDPEYQPPIYLVLGVIVTERDITPLVQ